VVGRAQYNLLWDRLRDETKEEPMTPKELLKLRNQKLNVGDTIKWHEGEVTLPVDPVRGAIPDTEVLEVTDKGGLKLGRFKCTKCGGDELVHPGDVFQKRLCGTCKKGTPKTEEEKAAKKAEKDAKRAEKEKEKLLSKIKENEQRLVTIKDEAERQNVEVSGKVSFN
jgi:hypothetical protein